MTERNVNLPVTLAQLQFFNMFIYRVAFDRVEELAPGITEFKCGIATPAFAPLTAPGYIWLDVDGNMVANIVTEKVSRSYPRDINDPEHFKNHDFPIKVRLFPNWREDWGRDNDMIEETFSEGRLVHPPGFPGSARQRVRDWIAEQLESEVTA